jgi:hypothetical protein
VIGDLRVPHGRVVRGRCRRRGVAEGRRDLLGGHPPLGLVGLLSAQEIQHRQGVGIGGK